VNERMRFVVECQRGLYTITELCERFGVSRKTGYKWLRRHREEGVEGLQDRSRAPHTCPHRTDPYAEAALVAERLKRPRWGAKKLLWRLGRQEPKTPWPARSTGNAILKRHGLVTPQRRRRRWEHPGRPTQPMDAPNAVWTADYKGEFRLGSGQYCYPLTVVDGYSRYILACEALESVKQEGAWAVFEDLFREYGLPEAIRTDNGVPFATQAIAGLSRLSVWWLKLGIRPQRIEPAKPEQNGRHERMHRTLKAETTRPPAKTLEEQQDVFDAFQWDYNHLRPHEGLELDTPARHYQPAIREYPDRLRDPEYPGHYEVRKVSQDGGIRWHCDWVFISRALAGEYIGLEEIDDGIWSPTRREREQGTRLGGVCRCRSR